MAYLSWLFRVNLLLTPYLNKEIRWWIDENSNLKIEYFIQCILPLFLSTVNVFNFSAEAGLESCVESIQQMTCEPGVKRTLKGLVQAVKYICSDGKAGICICKSKQRSSPFRAFDINKLLLQPLYSYNWFVLNSFQMANPKPEPHALHTVIAIKTGASLWPGNEGTTSIPWISMQYLHSH